MDPDHSVRVFGLMAMIDFSLVAVIVAIVWRHK